MAFKNYYEILGIDNRADTAEIRDAYRELAAKYTADGNKTDEFSQMMLKNINEAIDILANPEKRKEYDKTLILIDAGTRAAAVHTDINPQDAARIADLSEKYFEQEKQVKLKHEALLAAKNTKPVQYFTTVKVIFCLIIILGTTYYYHSDYFSFLKGTPVEEQRSYEWYTKDTTLIYAKPKNKAKVIWGVPAHTGFNGITETTYHIKITFTDEAGKSREGFIKKDDLEKSKELNLPTQ